MINTFLEEIKEFKFIDIGSSGNLQGNWKSIEHKINLVGFDPNIEECKRMTELPHKYKSVQYLPYAVAGKSGELPLYKTESIYCYSLLQPNLEWLKRFEFYNLFEVIGQETISASTLADISELREFNPDIIKTDTQGLELPILSQGKHFLESAFFVETETGFVQNYVGETTYAQIDEFMRNNNFLLFDLNINHRISRNNIYKDLKTNKEQILWCEAVWLKDYVSIYKKGRREENLTREGALKALIICSLQGCIDFGYELAELFYDLNLLTSSELQLLQKKDNWSLIHVETTDNTVKVPPKTTQSKIINSCLRLFPKRIRKEILKQAELSLSQKHLLRN